MLLNNEWDNSDIKNAEIVTSRMKSKIPSYSKNKNTTTQILWDRAKILLRRKFTASCNKKNITLII